MAEAIDPRWISALLRYFIWSDHMRVHFHQLLAAGKIEPNSAQETESSLYMAYWYAGLYVVVEGWRQLGLADPIVDQLLGSKNVALLKWYRRGVFHFQKEHHQQSFQDLIEQGEKILEWARELRNALNRFFQERIQEGNQTTHQRAADQDVSEEVKKT